MPATATTGRCSASRNNVWSPSESASICGIGRSQMSPDTSTEVDVVLVGDRRDLAEHLVELGHAIVAAEPLADVPVGRMQDLHAGSG